MTELKLIKPRPKEALTFRIHYTALTKKGILNGSVVVSETDEENAVEIAKRTATKMYQAATFSVVRIEALKGK